MNGSQNPPSVGAQDPELKNSPIMEEDDEDYEAIAQEIDGVRVCYFNNAAYTHGAYVCSGSGELLRCDNGLWVREGSCDPDNP